VKRNGLVVTLLLGLQLSVALGQLAETVCIVKITGRDRKVRYALMAEDNFSELWERIGREEGLYRKAMANAREAWKADPPVDKPFPVSAVSVPKATIADEAQDKDEARKILAEYEEQLAESRAREEERNERRLETKYTRESWSNEPGRERRKVRIDKEGMKQEREEMAAREVLYEQAREVYRKALRELWQPAEE